MKKAVLSVLLLAGILSAGTRCDAAAALELSGAQYDMFIICSRDLGDFCEKGEVTRDVFIFEDENFGIGSFEEDFYGLTGNGEYSANGFTFDADYVAIDSLVKSYDFTLRGFTIADVILLGTMDIEFTEYGLPTTEDEGSAFFLGIKK